MGGNESEYKDILVGFLDEKGDFTLKFLLRDFDFKGGESGFRRLVNLRVDAGGVVREVERLRESEGELQEAVEPPVLLVDWGDKRRYAGCLNGPASISVAIAVARAISDEDARGERYALGAKEDVERNEVGGGRRDFLSLWGL